MCLSLTEFPYKDLYQIGGSDELKSSKDNHPIFYGCFDWHSSVHGHWLMAAMAKRFPQDANLTSRVQEVFEAQFTQEKVAQEVAFLKSHKHYERTYGMYYLPLVGRNRGVSLVNA